MVSNAFYSPKCVLRIKSAKYDSRKCLFIPQVTMLFISLLSRTSQPLDVLGVCPCFRINKIITIMVNSLMLKSLLLQIFVSFQKSDKIIEPDLIYIFIKGDNGVFSFPKK